MPDTPPSEGDLRFYDNYLPSLETGPWRVEVSHTVAGVATGTSSWNFGLTLFDLIQSSSVWRSQSAALEASQGASTGTVVAIWSSCATTSVLPLVPNNHFT